MLTKEQIREKLKKDPFWEPDEDASYDEWDLYDEVCEDMENSGELNDDDEEDKSNTSEKSDEYYEDDEDPDWPSDDNY